MSDRRLRVLHLGNVANNGYNNAKILGDSVVSDVLCYGNYHIMASPEWEEAELDSEEVDADLPDWPRLTTYERPRSFAQGPFGLAAQYLEARRSGSKWIAGVRWQMLNLRRQLVSGRAWAPVRALRQSRRGTAPGAAIPPAADNDAAMYTLMRNWTVAQARSLFRRYDIVHAYGAEPILPFVANHHPFVAYEHGTLRRLPFMATAEGRLTAQAYRAADAVVITNADNREAATRLGLTRYRFIPHPTNESQPDEAAVAALRSDLTRRLDADFLIFHPSRQHWSADRDPNLEKGNDALIDALGRIVREHPRIGAVFVDWGESVDATRARLAMVGAASRVFWIKPQSGPSLARHIRAADIVADQFFLGAFGGITPRAMFLERPVLLHLDEAAHQWCLPDLPPVLNVRTAEQIASTVARAYRDAPWLQQMAHRAKLWYDAHHSSRVVRKLLLELYDDVHNRNHTARAS